MSQKFPPSSGLIPPTGPAAEGPRPPARIAPNGMRKPGPHGPIMATSVNSVVPGWAELEQGDISNTSLLELLTEALIDISND